MAKKKKYTVKFSIDFCGDYGTKEVITTKSLTCMSCGTWLWSISSQGRGH